MADWGPDRVRLDGARYGGPTVCFVCQRNTETMTEETIDVGLAGSVYLYLVPLCPDCVRRLPEVEEAIREDREADRPVRLFLDPQAAPPGS